MLSTSLNLICVAHVFVQILHVISCKHRRVLMQGPMPKTTHVVCVAQSWASAAIRGDGADVCKAKMGGAEVVECWCASGREGAS